MRFLLTLLFGTGVLAAQAQGYQPPRRYYTSRHELYHRPPMRLAIGFNLAHYTGDLTSAAKDNTYHLGLSLGLAQSLSPRVTFGADLGYTRLQATDHLPERGLRFESTNYQATAFVRYNLLADKNMFAGPLRRAAPVQVFVQAGVGGLLFDPAATRRTAESVVALDPEPLGGYPRLAAVLPVGGGLTLHASKALRLTVEGLYYFTSTDLLDDASRRTNPDTNDSYATLALKVEYAFYKKKGKPLARFD